MVTQFARFGLHPCRLHDGDRDLAVTLHAAWREDHYAATTIADLVEGMVVFLGAVLERIPPAA